MQAGYDRVAVVRGGFSALMEAGVAVAPKDVTSVSLPAASSAGGDPRPVGNLA